MGAAGLEQPEIFAGAGSGEGRAPSGQISAVKVLCKVCSSLLRLQSVADKRLAVGR